MDEDVKEAACEWLRSQPPAKRTIPDLKAELEQKSYLKSAKFSTQRFLSELLRAILVNEDSNFGAARKT